MKPDDHQYFDAEPVSFVTYNFVERDTTQLLLS